IVETLFTACDENDYNVRLTTEESLNKFVKNLKEVVLTRIQVELHRIIKHNPNVEPKILKDQLFEHHNQNVSTRLIICYLVNRMNDKLDSTSMINNEKRTSATKLVNQLYFFPIRYILNMDGTIKSHDELRISAKCATPTCLSHLSTI
ncbi:unnamed protein product, partial [Rotaria sordida]